jgi:hypothetical protein
VIASSHRLSPGHTLSFVGLLLLVRIWMTGIAGLRRA